MSPHSRVSSHERRRRSRARSSVRLSVEQLEPRRLLAVGEVGNWLWFETFDDVPRLAPEQLAAKPVFNSAFIGPRDLVAAEWIVQLDSDRTAETGSLSEFNSFFDHGTVDMTVVSGLGRPGLVLMRGRAVSVDQMEQSLSAHTDVEFFHRNSLVEGQSLPNDPEFLGGLLPGLKASGVEPAWQESTGSATVVVGVLDSGIDATHPDLFLNVWLNQGEIPSGFRDELVDVDGDGLITFYDLNNLQVSDQGIEVASTGALATVQQLTTSTPFAAGLNGEFVADLNGNGRIDAIDLLDDVRWADGRDNDGNTFFDDLFGVNFRSGARDDPFPRNRPLDELGHGTHVAGTIGAIGNNGFGVTGVNWQTSLMSLRILDNNNRSSAAAAIMAVNYASAMQSMLDVDSNGRVAQGANVRVLNNSWGQPSGFDRALEASIRESSDAGILFVAASGNGNILGEGVNNDQTPFFPASYEVNNVIAVAALSANEDSLASFSNFGPRSVDVAAPGVGVRSTLQGGGFGPANGTSMATPHVAGAAALIWAKLPFAEVAEVKRTLLSTTTPALAAPSSDQTGSPVQHGVINALGAITSDDYAPTAELLRADDIVAPGRTTQRLLVRFSHPSGIDPASLSNSTLQVQQNWGDRQLLIATLDPTSIQIEGNEVTADFVVPAPGGVFDPLDFGSYEITILPDTVLANSGDVGNRARNIGDFQVKIDTANVFYVDTTTDTPDINLGDGLALDGDGNTSLRAAIQEANQSAQEMTIILEAGNYRQRRTGTSENNAATGDLDITRSMNIVGDSAANVQIIGEHSDRIFHIQPTANLSLQRVTVIGGRVQGDGGGVLAEGNLDAEDVNLVSNVAQRGAAIAVMTGSNLRLTGNSSVELNRSTNTDLPNLRRVGGAIYFGWQTTGRIEGATIASNVTDGIAQVSSGTRNRTHLVHIENSTISNNTENGVYLLGAANLFHTTIVGNERLGINFWTGENVINDPQPRDGELLRIGSSIVVQNGVATTSFQTETGNITLGNNIVQDDRFSTALEIFNDETDVALQVGNGVVQPLDFYGTSIRHHPPVANGPAVDVGGNLSATDQFGEPRPVDGDSDGSRLSDAGAIELSDAKVQGTVFDDRNFNGLQDADEQGLSGQLVFIDTNRDGILNDDEPFAVTADDDLRTPTVNERGRYTLSRPSAAPQSFVIAPTAQWIVGEPSMQRLSETPTGQGGDGPSGASFPLFGDILETIAASISETGRFVSFTTEARNLPGENIDRLDRVATPSVGFALSNSKLAADGSRLAVVADDDFVAIGVVLTNPDGSTRLLGSPIGSQEFQLAQTDSLDITPDKRVIAFPQSEGLVVETPERRLVLGNVPATTSVSLSRDGNFIAYSDASTIRTRDLRDDRESVVTTLNGGLPGNVTRFPSLNGDATVMAFSSESRDLVVDDNNFASDVFLLRDGIVERISMTVDGEEASGDSSRPSISADGRFVVFESNAQLDSDDGNGVSDVYIYSTVTEQLALVSRGLQDASANGASGMPSISADGRYIVFTSIASNLIENDDNGFADVFLATNPFLGVLENAFGSSAPVLPGQTEGPSFALVPRPSTITGTVYEDAVENGAFDSGERGFSGVTVYVDLNRNGVLDANEPSEVTDELGDYRFTALPSNRDYSLAVIAPESFVQTPLGPNQFNHEFFLPPGSTLAGRDFGFRASAGTGQSGNSSISGRLYNDANQNGVFDVGVDAPLSGITVYLDSENFGVRDINEPAVLTSADGTYTIDQLGTRVVAVSAVVPKEFTNLSPRGSEFTLETIPLFDEVAPFGNAQSIVAADFNQDGFPDAATALAEANLVSIRINDGKGGFLPDGLDIELGEDGAGPASVVVGQFNGAGTPLDIAVANSLKSNVMVLFDFNGSDFDSRQTIAVGEEPLEVATVAVSGDANHLDLVVANKASNTIQFLRNTGGQFQALPEVGSGGISPVAIVTGEFTRDANLDVAVVHSKAASNATPFGDVRILRGDGTGNFELTPPRFEVGATPTDLILGNFDGDPAGIMDLAVANFGSNSISILTGQAQGGFTVQPQTLGTSSGALDIATTDIDRDGDLDVIASNLRDRNISIFRNATTTAGTTLFEPLEAIGLGQFSFAQRMPLTLANFDGDSSGGDEIGTIDILTIPSGTDTLHLLSNRLINGAHRVELTGVNQIEGLDFRVQPSSLPPRLDPIVDPIPTVEDAGPQSILLTGIRKGRGNGPDLRLSALSSNLDLLPNPTIDPVTGDGTAALHYESRPDANGEAEIFVTVTDAGADREFDTDDDTSAERSFRVKVLASNDPPTLILSETEFSLTDTAGQQVIEGFVVASSPGGGPDETGQELSGLTLTTSTNLFAESPTIDDAGTLRFRPANGVLGTALVQIELSDDGGSVNAGRDTSTFSFVIAVSSDRPQNIILDGDGNTFFLDQPELNLDSLQLIDIRGEGDNTLVLEADKIADLFPTREVQVVADPGDRIQFDDGWTFDSVRIVDGKLERRFVNGNARLKLMGPSDFVNPVDSFDVNGNGEVTALDALQIINELVRREFSDDQAVIADFTGVNLAQFRFYDVNVDQAISALDALQVINAVARRQSEGEAEQVFFFGDSRPTRPASSDLDTPTDNFTMINEAISMLVGSEKQTENQNPVASSDSDLAVSDAVAESDVNSIDEAIRTLLDQTDSLS